MDDLNEAAAHCPLCGAEYRAGFETCADDGTTLVRGAAPESGPWNAPIDRGDGVDDDHPPFLASDTGTAVVCRLPYEEAYLMAGRLEADGIPAAVDPPGYASAYPPAILHGGFDVIVPRDRYPEALEIVESIAGPAPTEP